VGLSGASTIDSVVARVAVIYGRAPRGYDRGADLAARAVAGLREYDARISSAAEHWRLERVGAIERNILRLAAREHGRGATPARVVIDEAVKLAHWFAGRAPRPSSTACSTRSPGRPARCENSRHQLE
jgi:N utilization substance protein B